MDKKIDQIILEQVPCEEFYEKMAAILNKMATISCVDKKTSCPTERAQHWYCLQHFVRISFLV
jgi:hypothetical protein